MIKLCDNFHIYSIDNKLQNSFEFEKYYNFIYKEFQIRLNISFSVVALSKKSNTVIVNFGYLVIIKKWSKKLMRYEELKNVDIQSGKSTKQYLDSPQAREIILRFIEKNIDNYLKTKKPALLIRGSLNKTQLYLPRYKRLDGMFFKNDYKKAELKTKKYKSLHKATFNCTDKNSKTIWAYCKDERMFKELKDVYYFKFMSMKVLYI